MKCQNFGCQSKNILFDKEKYCEKLYYDLRLTNQGIKRWVVAYRCPFYQCRDCKRNLKPPIMQKHKNISYGHTLVMWSMHQYIVNRVGVTAIESILREYFGVNIGDRRVWEFKNRAARYFEDTYNKILEKLVNGELIHADETGIRLQRGRGYVWVLTNMEEVYYLYRPTRESNFLHDLIKEFKGILISDFYTGYDSLNCAQQKCLVHLIRDLNNAILKKPLDDELKELVKTFGNLIRKIIKTIDNFGLKSRFLRKHKKDVKRFYKTLQKQTFNSEIAEKFKKRLVKYHEKLFLFLDYDNIPWNNNNAEHAIKHFAKYRRNVNGQVTERGIKSYLVLLSIYQTCKYKGINFLDFMLSKEKDIDEFESSYKK